MPRPPIEGEPQHDVLLRLRYLIDIARRHPTFEGTNRAIAYASEHPRALRSGHLRHNLGAARWQWLAEHDIYPLGEPTEIAGSPAVKGTITPEVKK